MKWGFILVTLYCGPLGLLLYVLADKEPYPGTHEDFIRPLWKQGVGSAAGGGFPDARAADYPGVPGVLYKTPGCGCCEDYATYLGKHGFKVTVKEAEDLASVSAKAGIPADLH